MVIKVAIKCKGKKMTGQQVYIIIIKIIIEKLKNWAEEVWKYKRENKEWKRTKNSSSLIREKKYVSLVIHFLPHYSSFFNTFFFFFFLHG